MSTVLLERSAPPTQATSHSLPDGPLSAEEPAEDCGESVAVLHRHRVSHANNHGAELREGHR